MDLNIIRSIILFVAGIILVLFPNKALKLQSIITRKLNIHYRDSKLTITIFGILLLITSIVLFILTMN